MDTEMISELIGVNRIAPNPVLSPSRPTKHRDLEFFDVAGLFVAACRDHARRPAYKIDGEWISYADCATRISRIADSLRYTLQRHTAESGKQPVIAVLLPNSYFVLECFFVAAVTGSIVFPLNDRLSAPELERGLHASGATVLLTSASYAKTLSAINWASTSVATVLWAGTAADLPILEHRSWDSLQSGTPFDRGSIQLESLLTYLHGFNTSGTTGQVKTILHSHSNVLAHTLATIDALGLSAEDRHCWAHVGPMFHVGDAVFVWIAVLLGAEHVFHDNRLDVGKVASLLSAERVTIVKLVPSMLQLLCSSEAVKRLQFPDLLWILTGGAAPDAALVRRTAELFGCDFIQGYGMTEATCHIAFKSEVRASEYEGLRVLPGLGVRIVDEDEQVIGSGRVGEITLNGPTIFDRCVLNGEFLAPADGFTADGFYRSGDLGFLDDDGKLHIVGRKKDMINVGGENVFAWEIEQIVRSLPGVKECAAFAVPHELLGEIVELAVVRCSEDLSTDQIKETCRKHLASFKVPHRTHFVEQLPRTPTGKVQKHLILEQLKAAAGPAAEATSPSGAGQIAQTVRQIVTGYMATLTSELIDPDEPLFDAGLDSLGALDLIVRFERRFQTTVSQTLLYDHPTISQLVAYFEAHAGTAGARAEPGHFSKDDKHRVAAAPEAGRRSPINPGSLLLQSIGILIRPIVLALSVVPVLVLFDLCARQLSGLQLLLTGPLWLGLLMADTMLIVVLLSWLLGSAKMKECPLWSPAYLRWLFVHNLFRSLEIPLGVLRGTPVLNTFYRLCGATIGKGVQLHTVALHDLDNVHIGDYTFVGRDVNLQPAEIGAGMLVRQPIHIGSGCLVGPNATILGGTQIPDGTLVPALATLSKSTAAPKFKTSPSPKAVFSTWRSRVRSLVGYMLVGYVVSAAIGLGMLFVQHAVAMTGADLPSISGVLLTDTSRSSPSLSFFAAIALAIYLVIPACYFALVVVCKRVLLTNLSPKQASKEFSLHPSWSHWLYSRLIDVPFFRMYLRLNVMSHWSKWNYQLLGSRIGSRPFLAAPYTAEPELIELADNTMVAGNVSAYGIHPLNGTIDNVRLGSSAIVANSCVLQAGAKLSERTLLGDLSSTSGGDASLPDTISVGAPPKVVGRTNFRSETISSPRYVLNQSALILLQWTCLSTSNVIGFLAMGLCFNSLVAIAPIWAVWIGLLILPVVPRLVKTGFVPLFKWVVLGKVRAEEYPAYGWHYSRWVLLETVIMDAEPAFLTQLHGTLWLSLLWRSLGARVGSNTCILSSSLGCEFDLKDIGANVVLQHQSLVFGHSIEHHSLLFKAVKIEDNAEIGGCAIVEAGAVVGKGAVVHPNRAVHARQTRTATGSKPAAPPASSSPVTQLILHSPPSKNETMSIVIDHNELADISRRIFAAAGSNQQEAAIVTEHLVEANLRGHDSHGVGMIPMYLRNLGKGTLRPNCTGRITSDNGPLVVYDGERGYGQIAARKATELGIARARENGVAVIALRNAHHIGRIGTYGEMCADAGLVSMHFVNITDQRPTVAPWRGSDARFGTNPVCVAIPAAEAGRPVILDMATSVIALGKVRVARNKGEQLSPGILLGADGQPTTDPGAMYRQPRGALVTFGEHKGYALAFICELLGGAIAGGGTMRPESQASGTTTNGMLSVIIDPLRLVDRTWLIDEIKAMTDYVTASPPVRPDVPVLIPGDLERQSRARRISDGVPIDDETWREIVEAAKSLNVPIGTPRIVIRPDSASSELVNSIHSQF
jgi:uncharacterized oxidoreductase